MSNSRSATAEERTENKLKPSKDVDPRRTTQPPNDWLIPYNNNAVIDGVEAIFC